jgi:hypothetical protein
VRTGMVNDNSDPRKQCNTPATVARATAYPGDTLYVTQGEDGFDPGFPIFVGDIKKLTYLVKPREKRAMQG